MTLLMAPLVAALVAFFSTLLAAAVFMRQQRREKGGSTLLDRSLRQIDWPTIVRQHISAIDISSHLVQLAELHCDKFITRLQQRIPFAASLIKGPVVDTVKNIVKEELIHLEPSLKEYMATAICSYLQEDGAKKLLCSELVDPLVQGSVARKLLHAFAAFVGLLVFFSSLFMALVMA